MNQFLMANLNHIERIKKFLIELEMKGSYREVPLTQIRNIFDGMKLEISKLQGEVDEIKKLIPKEVVNEQAPQSQQENEGK